MPNINDAVVYAALNAFMQRVAITTRRSIKVYMSPEKAAITLDHKLEKVKHEGDSKKVICLRSSVNYAKVE